RKAKSTSSCPTKISSTRAPAIAMRIDVVTLFPELFTSVLSASLLGKALERGLFEVRLVQIRDFSDNKHKTVDDAPFGGGSGMVMMPGPLSAAIEAASAHADDQPTPRRILLTPQGSPFDQAKARELAGLERVVLVCGRYEGIDERVRLTVIDEELSVGDYV